MIGLLTFYSQAFRLLHRRKAGPLPASEAVQDFSIISVFDQPSLQARG